MSSGQVQVRPPLGVGRQRKRQPPLFSTQALEPSKFRNVSFSHESSESELVYLTYVQIYTLMSAPCMHGAHAGLKSP